MYWYKRKSTITQKEMKFINEVKIQDKYKSNRNIG